MYFSLSNRVFSPVAAGLALAVGAGGCSSQVGPGYEGEVVASVQGIVQNDRTEPVDTVEAALVWLNGTRWDDPQTIGTSCGSTADTRDPAGGTVSCTDIQGPGGAVVFQRTAVEGQFPARFRLDLFGPPDEAAMNDYGPVSDVPESRFGVAMIVGLAPGQYPDGVVSFSDDEAVDEAEEMGPPLGVAEHHVLAYVETDVQAGSETARVLGGALAAGYHVLDVVPGSDPVPGSAPDGSDDRLEPSDEDSEPAIETDSDASERDRLAPSADGLDTSVEVRLADEDDLRFPGIDQVIYPDAPDDEAPTPTAPPSGSDGTAN